MSTEERKLAAIVFTDICGFTELMARDENKAMALLEQQRTLLKPIITNFNGEWLKEMGDGVLISFPSAVKAVTCSLEIQRILAHNPDLTLRIGIHIGDIIKKDGDVFGDGVNIASRLEPLAEPGGICVSERVHEDIQNKPDISTAFQEEQLLKGIDKPIKVYSIFTQMGNAPAPKTNAPTPKSTKSKMPYIIAGIVIGLMVSVFALKNASDNNRPPDGNSLAVFNFENLSVENETDRTGQILQELIITDLSGINDFKIYSSQRLFDIQKQIGTKDSRFIDPSLAMDIAKKAGATSMMTGNIIKVGNTIVLTSRLLDVGDGSVIKSRKVEGSDIYAMVDELSSYVIEDLQLGMIETVNLAVSEKTSSNMTAYGHFVTGVELINEIKFNKAVVELQKAVSIDPSFKKAIYKLAIAQWWAKGAEVAHSDSATIATLNSYLSLPDIDDDEVKLANGVKNIVSNKYTDALESFKHLTDTYPDNKEYWYLLGEVLYHGFQKAIQSIDAFERAVELDPEFTLAYEHIFDIYKEQLLHERGIRAAKKLIDAFPKKSKGYLYLAMFYRVSGKPMQAVEVLEQAKKIFPEHSYQRQIATNYVLMGLYNDALRICDEILSDDITPNLKISMLDSKYKIYSILGEYSKCRELLQVMLSLAKEHAPGQVTGINIDIALTYQYAGDYNQASQYLDRAKELNLKGQGMMSGWLKYFILYYRVLLYVDASDDVALALTVANFRTLLDGEEETAMIRQWMEPGYRGLLFEKLAIQGQIESALVTFEALPIKQNEMELHYNSAGKLYIEKGDFKKALRCADDMQIMGSSNFAFSFTFPRSHYIRGMAYDAMGNAEKAKESYDALLDLWKNADSTIPELIDTKKRLAKLKKAS